MAVMRLYWALWGGQGLFEGLHMAGETVWDYIAVSDSIWLRRGEGTGKGLRMTERSVTQAC